MIGWHTPPHPPSFTFRVPLQPYLLTVTPFTKNFLLQTMFKWHYYKKHKSNWNVDCGDFNRQIIFRQKIPFKTVPQNMKGKGFFFHLNFERWLWINYLNYYFSMIINIIQIHSFLLGHYSTVQGLQFHVCLCKQMQIIPKRIFVQLWHKHELPMNCQQELFGKTYSNRSPISRYLHFIRQF